MAQQYPYSWNYCATCAYWTGVRETNYFGEWVKVDSYDSRGKCMCRGNGWTNHEKQACASCPKHERWAPLKK